MAVDSIRIENTTDGYVFNMSPIQSADESQRKEAFSISPPGRPPEDNIFLGVSGQQSDIEIVGYLYNDGTDRAVSTAPTGEYTNDTVVDLREQADYLLNYVHAADFSVSWQLTHFTSTGQQFTQDEVFFESIDIPRISQSSPKWREVRMTFRRGKSI